MKTLDVIKSGIDRNFLRKCIKEGLISPKKKDNIGIVNKNYVPQEYTQEDIEIVWNAYLYRQMGLSYEQIKALNRREKINFRESLNNRILKYQQQMEELQAIVDFMKYVKGLGFIPNPPDKLMGSKSFKDYLIDCMYYLDEDKKLKKVLEIAEFISESNDFEEIQEDRIEKIETTAKELAPHFNQKDQEEQALTLMMLKDKTNLDPACEEIQEIIHKLFYYQKKLSNNPDLTAWDFAGTHIYLLSRDSDMSMVYKKMLGKETLEYLIKALVAFLCIQEPDEIKSISAEPNNNSNE